MEIKCNLVSTTYQKVNITIAAVLCGVLLLLFWGVTAGLIKCPFQSQFGVTCSSCGISRDIINYICLDFRNPLNPYSLNVFIFFVVQIIVRACLFKFPRRLSLTWQLADITISVIWAIWLLSLLLF